MERKINKVFKELTLGVYATSNLKFNIVIALILIVSLFIINTSCSSHKKSIDEKSKEEFAEMVDKEWPIREKEVVGVLFLTRNGYLAIKLENPVVVNPWTKEEAAELQLIPFNDEKQWDKARRKVGSKVWMKGLLGPRQTPYYELDSVILVNKIKYL